ncbi:TMEM175 family protein [Actinoplanes oblitus]|uniref:TMEM175 family protein n=1 Tax=Actinoplanes oblitus TaxID=3040509 RepID=A0ABY8W7P9_9ACTN|nr:TMEM175 family protein [Actinoplanes oblitus]WIM93517.1 TMEM175 family protein [Actinoplanes oblitus]
MIEPEQPAASTERLVLFTDAVAAIAITLLILPLLETLADVEEHTDLSELIRENLPGFGAFLLGFAVIFRFWWGHHRVFGHLSRLSGPIVILSGLWTLSIVMLPIQTAIITDFPPSSGTVALYCGTMLLAVGALATLSAYAYRHPELSAGRTPLPFPVVTGSLVTFGALLLAGVIGVAFPQINYWAFFLLFLTGPVEKLLRSRRRRVRQSV